MTGDWLSIAAVLSAIVALFVATDFLGRRFQVHPEVRRKILHFGTGFIGLSFPWIFDAFWPVAVISATSFAGLLALRGSRSLRAGLGASIHGVGRRSFGDFVVPLAIASLYLLADGDVVLYVVPILLLTLADGSAALAAINYGLSPYPTLDGKKTFEGTTVFFAVASWAVLVPLMLMSDLGREEVLLVTLVVALISSLVEATSWSGLDNVFVPWGSFFALRRCTSMSTTALLVELIVLLTLAVVIFVGARRARLTLQAKFSVLLGTFVIWALVGWYWVAPAAMVLVLHPFIVRIPPEEPTAVDLRAVISVASTTVWVFLDQLGVADQGGIHYAFAVGVAAHLTMICEGRCRSMRRPVSRAVRIRWSAIAMAVVVAWYPIYVGPSLASVLLVGLSLPLLLITSFAFAATPAPPLTTRSWVLQAYFGLQASAIAFVVHGLLGDSP